jgi:hypothetical protein
MTTIPIYLRVSICSSPFDNEGETHELYEDITDVATIFEVSPIDIVRIIQHHIVVRHPDGERYYLHWGARLFD